MRGVLCSIAVLLLASASHAQIVINELRIDQPGTDIEEFFELAGPPGASLDGLTYVVIGDTGSMNSGIVEEAEPLDGFVLSPTGYFVAAEASFTVGVADLTTDLAFENSDNVTHMLIEGFTGVIGDDLDTDDDGVFDVTPWTAITDLIAIVEEDNPPSGTEFHYGPPSIGPDVSPAGSFVPSFVRRCPDMTGDFLIGAFGVAAAPGPYDETPGAPNFCPECLAPIALTCVSDCSIPNVTLSWTNSDTYDSIEIYQSGAIVTTIAGTETSYIDASAPAGLLEYEVVGVCDLSGTLVPSPTLTCSLIHSPYNGERHLIFAGEESDGTVNSVQLLNTSLNSVGETTLIIGQLDGFACFSTFIQPGNVMWVMLGTFPNDGELTEDDGQVLADLVNAGVAIYLEGADHFSYNPFTPFHDYDGCDNSTNDPGVSFCATTPPVPPCNPFEGDDTLTELNGLMHGSLDLTTLQQVVYTQDNNGGNDYTDRVIPATTDLLGTNVGLIWENSPDLLPDPAIVEVVYGVGLFYDTTGGAGNVISTSFEFGGVGDDLVDLALTYIDALVPTLTGDVFVRGDANSDDNYDISDAVFSLAALFTPGAPPPSCNDAADSNDDGGFDISDAVYTLGALFTPGSPQPTAPFPDCGVDPSMDSLACTSSPCP